MSYASRKNQLLSVQAPLSGLPLIRSRNPRGEYSEDLENLRAAISDEIYFIWAACCLRIDDQVGRRGRPKTRQTRNDFLTPEEAL